MRLVLALLCLVGLALAVTPARFAEVRRRRSIATSCSPVPTGTTVGSDSNSLFDGTKYTGGNSCLDGHDTTGEIPTSGKVDYCHIEPALCNPSGSTNFCTASASKNVCCPHSATAGTKNAVAVAKSLGKGCGSVSVPGMARLFMPQVANEGKLLTWIGTKSSTIPLSSGTAAAFTASQPIDPAAVSFSQGEINADKILGMACKVPTTDGSAHVVSGYAKNFPSGTPALTDDPYVCAGDNFVLDGHHRVAAFRWYNAHIAASGTGGPITKVNVNKLNVKCVDLIAELAKEIDWTGVDTWAHSASGSGFGAYKTAAKDLTSTVGSKFAGLLEIQARFGTSAHATVQAARAAYVDQTRQRLADIGVALKGGDEALALHFDAKHAPILWS